MPAALGERFVQPEPFEEHSSLLFAIAYRMVGSAMEAEDIVQEAYLRYSATPPESIRSLKSFLTTIVHHLCIDHLSSARVRRESYVGPWLPEPIITDEGATFHSPLRQILDRESISMAFLVLLESLSPLERSVFLLREVFDFRYSEIAQITGREEAACRQLFSRAKKHIKAHRPHLPASPEAHARMLDRFTDAFVAGDVESLMRMMSDEITVWSDGGGKVQGAALQPVRGREKVVRGILGLLSRAPAGTTFETIEANGQPALLTKVNGNLISVLTLELDGDVIRTIRNVANPDKLAHLGLPPTTGRTWQVA